MFIQTGEEPVPALPAAFARRSTGGDAAAVGGFGVVGGEPGEPAHFAAISLKIGVGVV